MKLFLGPPGTGKTTRLLGVVEQELTNGVLPPEVAFLAFTRKAAHEARDRAMEQFGLTEEQLPFFRTIHSFAFRQLGLTSDEVLANKDYAEIGHAIGMAFGEVYDTEDENALPVGASDKRGNNCAYIDQIARLTEKTLKETCVQMALERYWDVQLYRDTVDNYKRTRHKVDFTDMMERYAQGGEVPRLRVVILDEAQDLTPLQWRVATRIMAVAERVYIAGDDDQAIYEWAGADVKKFLSLEGEKEVLPISYRLPNSVFDKALQVLKRIRHRYEKSWCPNPDKGSGAVHYYSDPDQADFREGSWLLLCRNRYMMAAYCGVMKRLGYPYVIHGKSSVDNETVKALLGWETLRNGGQITYDLAKVVTKRLRPGALPPKALAGVGVDEPITLTTLERVGLTTKEDWMTALNIPDAAREYYRAIRRHGESFIKWPRITISTIHQSKGGEADNVMIYPDISDACYQGTKTNPDIESRVFYVAVTRAKSALHIIYPHSNKYYELRGNV